MTLQLNVFKVVAFIFVFIINLLYIMDLSLDSSGTQSFAHPQYEWINLILTIF